VVATVGGKAGGKGATSVGSGSDVSKIDQGIEAAVKHLEKLEI
jgi:alanyl-tRNA synthetase